MKKLMICKCCGYIMEEGKIGAVCPACGVPRNIFIPYEDPVEPARRKVIALDIHPVIVHAPQAFAFTILLAAVGYQLAPNTWMPALAGAVLTLTALLPLTVIAAFVSGIVDGKARFRKATTPILVKKMVWGGLFFLASLGMAWLALTGVSLAEQARYWIFVGLTVLAVGASTVLGLVGARLMDCVFVKLGPKPKTD